MKVGLYGSDVNNQAYISRALSNSAISALPYENQGTNMFSQHARDLANCLLY